MVHSSKNYLAVPMDQVAKKIVQEIKSKKPSPVYFLQGEENYYIDFIANVLQNEFLGEGEKSFNQVVLYGGETNLPTILSNARKFPMMSEHQVVLVKEAQELSDLYKEPGSKLLLDYFGKPVPSTVLMFCHKHKTLDKRKEFGKKAEQSGVVTTFKKIPDYKLADFVMELVSEKGFRIEEGAAQILSESVGNDLSRIDNELEKVMITRAPGATITTDQVMKEVGVSREYNIFELQKAVTTRNLPKAYAIVRYFQANPRKNPVIPNIAFLYSFFSKLLAAASLPDQSSRSLIAQLKMSPMMANDYATALRYYPAQRIRENISVLKEADLRVKGFGSQGDSDGDILLETVLRLMA